MLRLEVVQSILGNGYAPDFVDCRVLFHVECCHCAETRASATHTQKVIAETSNLKRTKQKHVTHPVFLGNESNPVAF